MNTIETNHLDQDQSAVHDGEVQPPGSQPENPLPSPVNPMQTERSPVIICPHCQQEHAVDTLYCPTTGKPLAVAPQPVAQSQQTPLPKPVQGYVPSQPQYPQAPYIPYPQRPPKDRNIALILEILPGLFGILGIGWIYSGKTGTGLAWLIGYLIWVAIAIAAAALSGALACFCTVPINLLCVGISAYSLNSYTKNNPQLFGA